MNISNAVIDKYESVDGIYDLAKSESTLADGMRENSSQAREMYILL